jgi:hypothetical protein
MSHHLIRQDQSAVHEAQRAALSPRTERMIRAALGEEKCPSCGMLFHPTMAGGELQIAWDDTERQFTVEASVSRYCNQCHQHEREATRRPRSTLASVPLEIAQTSSCSCGSTLDLKDYSLRVANGDLQFSATYVCQTCIEQRKTARSGIGSMLLSLWSLTKKVKIGADGIEYEKEATK